MVRVKRGSTWMTLAPLSLACITQRKATGWHSAMLEPSMRMAVRVDQATGEGCRRAAAESHPQTGDAGGVSYAGLVFDGDDPQAAHQLLLDVVPLVVHRGAAEGEDGGGGHLDLLLRLAVGVGPW